MRPRLFLTSLLAGVFVGGFPLYAADLVVMVDNLRSGEGLLRLALYDRAELFPKQGEGRFKIDLPARAGRMEVVFPGLAPGRYALALFHDENGDNIFDQGLFGLPQEGYGFSRDAPVFLSAPSFDQAAVDVAEPSRIITVHLSYWNRDEPREGPLKLFGQ